MPEKIALGFGSNSGNRLANIKKAVKELALSDRLNLLALSGIYETEPWGYTRQNNFLNCAGIFLCRLNPQELIGLTAETEKKAGRTKREKWREREIDIDLLFFGNRIIKQINLTVPHKYLHKRNFVLKPLVELIPGFIHPGYRKSIRQLYCSSPDSGKVKYFTSILAGK